MTTGLRGLGLAALPLLFGGWALVPAPQAAPQPDIETSMGNEPGAEPAPSPPETTASAPRPVAAVPAAPAPAAPAPVPAPIAKSPQPAPTSAAVFGDAGQLILSGSVSVGHLGYSASEASSTSISVQPAIDYFVREDFSIGASAFFRFSDSVSGIGIATRTTAFGAYGRIGDNVRMKGPFSFRPVASVGVWWEQTSSTAPGSGYVVSVNGTPVSTDSDVSQNVVVFELFAPLLVHPVSHFFLGLGPDVYFDVSHRVASTSNNRTYYGLSSVIGGWF